MKPANSITEFSPEIQEQLQYYVYRLIDPRNGETFYVGKGKGSRLFQHIKGERAADDGILDGKLERIREIRNSGLDVVQIVHRHGMDEKTAFEVEAALIDAFPGLANIAGGHGSEDVGPMHVWQIKQRYEAETAEFVHKALLVSINQTATASEIYDATRYAWRLDVKKAGKAEVILATRSGVIVGAFVADKWMESTPDNFPGFPAIDGRWGFVGHPAPEAIARLYLQKRTPDAMRKRGAANPIRYTF